MRKTSGYREYGVEYVLIQASSKQSAVNKLHAAGYTSIAELDVEEVRFTQGVSDEYSYHE